MGNKLHLLLPTLSFLRTTRAQLAIDPLPIMSNVAGTVTLSNHTTTECVQCIRAGWIWCSS